MESMVDPDDAPADALRERVRVAVLNGASATARSRLLAVGLRLRRDRRALGDAARGAAGTSSTAAGSTWPTSRRSSGASSPAA